MNAGKRPNPPMTTNGGGDIFGIVVAHCLTLDVPAAEAARLVHEAMGALNREEKIRSRRNTVDLLRQTVVQLDAASARRSFREAGTIAALAVAMLARVDSIELATNIGTKLQPLMERLTPGAVTPTVLGELKEILVESILIVERETAELLQEAIAVGRSTDPVPDRPTAPAVPVAKTVPPPADAPDAAPTVEINAGIDTRQDPQAIADGMKAVLEATSKNVLPGI